MLQLFGPLELARFLDATKQEPSSRFCSDILCHSDKPRQSIGAGIEHEVNQGKTHTQQLLSLVVSPCFQLCLSEVSKTSETGRWHQEDCQQYHFRCRATGCFGSYGQQHSS